MVGPSGYGHLGLLQSLVGLAGIVVELGLGTAVVQEGARLVGIQDKTGATRVWSTAASTMILSGGGAVVVLVSFRSQIAGWVLDNDDLGSHVTWSAVTLALSLAGNFRTSVLTAHRAVTDLAKTTIITTFVGSAGALALAGQFGTAGLAPGMAFTAATRWAVAWFLTAKHCDVRWLHLFSRGWAGHAKSLLSVGLPVTGSILVGPGVQTALPLLLLQFVGKSGVGLYQAASSIVLVFFGFLAATVGQDYYPRLRALADDGQATAMLVSQQHRLMILLTGTIALCAKAGLPFVVPILLAKDFVGLTTILDWHLPGEIVRFSSVTFSYLVLSRGGGVLFFLTSMVNGLVLLGGILFLVPWLGVQGAGVAFLLAYSTYWVLMVGVCWQRFKVRPKNSELRLLSLTLVCACMPNLISRSPAKPILETVFALGFVLFALRALTKEFGWTFAKLRPTR